MAAAFQLEGPAARSTEALPEGGLRQQKEGARPARLAALMGDKEPIPPRVSCLGYEMLNYKSGKRSSLGFQHSFLSLSL